MLFRSKKQLFRAIKNTFRNRETNIDIDEFKEVIALLRTDQTILNHWTNYTKRFYYAKNISFEDILNTLDKIIELVSMSDF